MLRRDFVRAAGTAASVGLFSRIAVAATEGLAGAQIRMIVPFPAGGPTDIVARPLAQALGDALKATLVVDNRGGAGGSIGANAVAKSAADGRTLLMATVGTQAINPALYKSLPYDAVRDFTPIALVAVAPVAIVANPALKANSLAELVALAKSMPGKLNYGSAGPGTPGHLTAEMFKSVAGIDVQHVPYKGSARRLFPQFTSSQSWDVLPNDQSTLLGSLIAKSRRPHGLSETGSIITPYFATMCRS